MAKTLDWDIIDKLITEYLPSLTIKEFTKQHTPYTIPRTIGQRAKKLNIKPASRVISEDQKQTIRARHSKYTSTPEIDDFLRDNLARGVNFLAMSANWSRYAVYKRLDELGLKAPVVIGEDIYVVPNSNRIDWEQYDGLIKQHLPNMNITDFTIQFAPLVSAKMVGKRAKKLNVRFKREIKQSHREMISLHKNIKIHNFTPEQDQFIRDNKDNLGHEEIADELGVPRVTTWRRMITLGIRRDEGIARMITNAKCAIKGHIGALRAIARIEAMSESEYLAYRQRLSDTARRLIAEGRMKPGRGIGIQMDTKKGGQFRTRSSYETRYVDLLESNLEVIRFEYEPFQIDYEHDGIIKGYTPDFLVFYADRAELVEVKPSRMVNEGRNPAKFIAAERHCLDEGFSFVVVTEAELVI
jgi:hypothetical protein